VCVVIAVVAVNGAMEVPINSVHVIPDSPGFVTQTSDKNGVADIPTMTTLADVGVTCSFSDGSNSWNLAPLTKPVGGGDYKGSDANYDYKMNVCGVSNAGQGCTENGYSICQYSQSGGVFVASLGSFAEAPKWAAIAGGGGVQYTMTNGNKCWIAGKEIIRTVVLQFKCAGSTSDTIVVTEDQNTCTFTLVLSTQYGCAGSGGGGGSGSGLGGGRIFINIVVAIIPIYVLAGCLFKWKSKGTQFGTMDSCPNGEFWRDLPALVKDGARFAFSGCKKKNYTQI